MKRIFYLAVISSIMWNCQSLGEGETSTQNADSNLFIMKFNDVHTFSQPEVARITHLEWDANVDFENKMIDAVAKYNIWTSDEASEIFFDTKNDMEILDVLADDAPAKFSIGDEVEHLGRPLRVEVLPSTKTISITYKTNPKAAALQWLSPQQTANKTAPFLFTQSQAILCRSWIPIQDGPGIRFTYNAKVRVPTGLMALMSAKNPQTKSKDGVYSFTMTQPVPAYLMALTVGDVDYKQLGAHTGIYAESSMMEKSAYEFAEMEDMLIAAEKLYGKYQWEVYDMIILPPSFPFGGMENPRLTFATPTILAGDRSLTALVAHELAHSWSGNLVTNATWDDFWLNEGFTVYFERRIMESLYGADYAEMLAQLGYQDLQETVEGFLEKNQARDTHLKLDLKDRDPDDGMSDIAYEKGYFMLRLLEKAVGREQWDAFLKDYFQTNAFKVMTTEAFVDHLKTNLLGDMKYDELKLDAWIYGPGLPDNCPTPESNKFTIVEKQISDWQNGTALTELETNNWSSHEWLHFVRYLPVGLTYIQMKQLDETFGFTKSGNSEILAAWFQHTIANNYKPADQVMSDFLVNVGRRKFLTPTYKALLAAGKKDQAIAIYNIARPNYHSVATQTMDELLGVK